MMRALTIALLCAATTSPPTALLAQDDFFSSGNDAYQNGSYDQALESYLHIVEAGFESSPLYYNIGNTYFKLGNLGLSILNYERAARLDPGSEDVAANLTLARSLTADEISALPQFWLLRAASWWTHAIPRATLSILTAAAYMITIGALVFTTLGKAPRILGRTALATGVVTAALTINLLALEFEWGSSVEAIVLGEEAPVYSAPSEDVDLLVFNVHEGTKVRIDEEAGDWIEIVLEDGNVGWMKTAGTETI
jgi:tetratricopeptide (TPR) repeat protein